MSMEITNEVIYNILKRIQADVDTIKRAVSEPTRVSFRTRASDLRLDDLEASRKTPPGLE